MIKVPETVMENLLLHYGLKREDITLLGGGREDSDGIVYSCIWNARESVFKVMAFSNNNLNSISCHDERLNFVRYLGENGANIVFPQPTRDGNLYVTHQGVEHTFMAYMMDRVNGKHQLPKDWNDTFYQQWGKAVGLMHRLAKDYPKELPFDGENQSSLGWEQEWQSFYELSRDEEVKKQWKVIKERLKELPISRDAYGFIHNDPHIQNLLVEGDNVTFFDFDVANYHWFITDISIATQGVLFEQSGGMERPLHDPAPLKFFLENFIKGYELENHLERGWLEKIDLLISYRRLLLFTVMQDWLETKKEVKDSWKKLIMEDPQYIDEYKLLDF